MDLPRITRESPIGQQRRPERRNRKGGFDMHTRKPGRLLTAGAFAIAIAIGNGLGMSDPASAQQPRKLVYATYIPDTLSIVKADKWFMDEVTRRTNGRVTFEI